MYTDAAQTGEDVAQTGGPRDRLGCVREDWPHVGRALRGPLERGVHSSVGEDTAYFVQGLLRLT